MRLLSCSLSRIGMMDLLNICSKEFLDVDCYNENNNGCTKFMYVKRVLSSGKRNW